MGDLYAFVTPAQLLSGDDPVEILVAAATLEDLLALAAYDPDGASVWARDKVHPTGQTVQIRNAKTDLAVAATVCGLDS